MTLREYFDAQGFEYFKMIALYEDGVLIGHLPALLWRGSKYKDRKVLAVDDYAILVRGVSK